MCGNNPSMRSGQQAPCSSVCARRLTAATAASASTRSIAAAAGRAAYYHDGDYMAQDDYCAYGQKLGCMGA